MGLSLDTINELAKVGGIAALFGLGMWLVYSLAIEGTAHGGDRGASH